MSKSVIFSPGIESKVNATIVAVAGDDCFVAPSLFGGKGAQEDDYTCVKYHLGWCIHPHI